MRSKNFEYTVIEYKEFSIIRIKDRKNRIFDVLLDNKNLKRVIDFEYAWHVTWHHTEEYYVVASIYKGIVNGKAKYQTILLQRFILSDKISKRDKVDHKNGNKLDNRENNLRITNNSNNGRNRKGKNKNNTSGCRNVCWINGWLRIQLQIDGKNHLFPEKFKDIEKATEFAQEMRKKYYGEYAGKG